MDERELREALRSASRGDGLQITVEGDVFSVTITGPITYEEPDSYGAGYLSASVELDTDEHDVPTDFPSETGEIATSTNVTGQWEVLKFSIWEPVMDDDDPELIVDDEWITVGTVEKLEVLDDQETTNDS